MRYVAGIDGGQSGTQAAIADESGRVLGTGAAGPSDENWQGSGSTRMRDALAGALAAARRAAGLDEATRFAAIVAGVSGYEGRLYGEAPSLPAERFSLVHDAVVAHAGALGGGSGVVVIAGTGSIAYVVDDAERSGVHGGLGYVFGDEGSGFWIAKTALAAAVTAGESCAVASAARAYFAQPSIREIFAAFYHGTLDRDRFASFARRVLELFDSEGADDVDACAYDTVVAAREDLASLAAWAARPPWQWRGRARASFVGGLVGDRAFKDGIYAATRAKAPELEIVEPVYPPALGAVVLAMREAKMAPVQLAT